MRAFVLELLLSYVETKHNVELSRGLYAADTPSHHIVSNCMHFIIIYTHHVRLQSAEAAHASGHAQGPLVPPQDRRQGDQQDAVRAQV